MWHKDEDTKVDWKVSFLSFGFSSFCISASQLCVALKRKTSLTVLLLVGFFPQVEEQESYSPV